MFNKSSNTTLQTINTSDNRLALENSLGISGNGSSITTNTTDNTTINTYALDGGAIKSAMDLGANALAKMLDSQRVAADFSATTAKNAFEAIGETQHSSALLGQKAVDAIAEANRQTTAGIANAWNNAKVAESGKTLGDFKYIVFGLIGIFAVLAYRQGKA